MNLWLILLTGLTSGGVTCASMQGGILASTIANQKKEKIVPGFGVDDWGGVASFLTTKLITHMILGFFLGWLGFTITFSLDTRLFFQGFAALFMFASAMNLLEVHPIFRFMAFTPPKFARSLIKSNTTTDRLFAPGLLGFLTILIPCGVTQAMEILAISSGSPLQGTLIMGTFVLGTAPMFVLIGIATAKLSEVWRVYFLRIAAILLIAMALYSANGILQVIDSSYSLQRLGPRIVKLLPPYDTAPRRGALTPTIVGGVQSVTINILNSGYSPKHFTVKVGIPVKLTVNAGEVYSCATAFTFHAFGINAFVKPNTSQIFTFTPDKKGLYTFSCSMGMYSGSMEVI
ncbi:hypothetical protein COT87_02880 [Candidatus Collierbacteria bacterium CG10_big_fil_rev_8_21_14_0_10_44_9]|uniref:Urease accessory protein UreH-like transmembrane domain-containing protein n=1 Tax=Candidatus Collierbacteria bacterium CG10_big_fil_rev_8_21_14_0_10_44_9 TaxID=1974535 RepID=A0A2H0VI90_9BACT|nr:MAG: hypothetical protein COT87_02880 [Candidatus Collierbacteria bacterium CG10_big_fil_rev_8_21_14_0_10_44_9]